jgi:hypothetical protein
MVEIATDESVKFQCRHIFTDGRRCGSPTLRSPAGHEPFCFYHHNSRGAASMTNRDPARAAAQPSTFVLPTPEDRSSIQHALGQVLQRIASNEIDPRRAGLLLYGLQIASLNLKKDREIPDEDDSGAFVTEITLDPDHGVLAPPAELHADQPIGSAQRLLYELGYPDDVPPSEPPQTWPSPSEPLDPEAPQTAAPGNLTVDLQAFAASEHETIFRMSNFIPKPASPKLTGLGPRAQKLAALREKAAAQANNASATATADAASAAKPKNSVARKTAFQRKAT